MPPPAIDVPDIGENSGWSVSSRRAEEKTILVDMMEYLHRDPTMVNNNTLLRFLLCEWKPLWQTIHTSASMNKLKSALITMGTPYIKYQVSPSVWSFWTDYTPAGIANFHRQDLGLKDGTTPLHGSNTSQSTWTTADMEGTQQVVHRTPSQPSTQPSVSAASASQQDLPSMQPYPVP